MIKETISRLAEHKRKIWGVVIVLIFVGVLNVAAHAMFRVQGVVKGVEGSQVTVADFFRTQTLDLSGAAVNMAAIKPGERIFVQKNLQGEVLYVSVAKERHGQERERHNRPDGRNGNIEHGVVKPDNR
ncbi:hypothetical protein [Azotosporobacter soli]|uniref:hypothetical protein n=1 Tax=Azotosporobacter soli TaxID=3055040 RepID=UPI0031FE4B5D